MKNKIAIVLFLYSYNHFQLNIVPKLASEISRVFYFLHNQDTFILLHGFSKKTDDTPINELEKAKSHMIDYMQRRDD